MATASSLLRDHVTLQVRSVDRVFMHAYVPGLMTKYQVIRFLLPGATSSRRRRPLARSARRS